jgi:hypothetical protein
MNSSAITLASAAVCALLLGACDMHIGSGSGPEVEGNGVTKSEARPVGAFHAIELAAPIQLELASGPLDVELSADENVLPLVTTAVSDGKLVVGVTRQVRTKALPVLTIHAIGIDRIDAKGVGRVHASGIDAPRFALAVAGACDAELTGKTERLDVEAGGAANVHASDLVAKEVHVDLSGTGSVEVDATDKLDASVSGMGAILYRGSPVVAKTVAGLGTVKPLS